MRLNLTLSEEQRKRFETIKEHCGMVSNPNVVNFLIAQEYRRLVKRLRHQVYMQKTQKLFEYDEACIHCSNNPQGKKPYEPMKRFGMTNLTETAAYKLAQENKVEPSCILCHVVRAFVKLPIEEGLKMLEVEKHGNNKD